MKKAKTSFKTRMYSIVKSILILLPLAIGIVSTMAIPIQTPIKILLATIELFFLTIGILWKRSINIVFITQIAVATSIVSIIATVINLSLPQTQLILLGLVAVVLFVGRYLFSIKASEADKSSKNIHEACQKFFYKVMARMWAQLLLMYCVIFIIGIADSFRVIDIPWWVNLAPIITLGIILINTTINLIINRKIFSEVWIPIFNANGKEIGRTTYSELVINKGYITGFPGIVRVLPISNGMVYLEHKEPDEICPKGGYDTPLRKILTINSEIKKTAQQIVKEYLGDDKVHELRYFMKYLVDGGNNSGRYIWLFLIHLNSLEPIIRGSKPVDSKWWPLEQIKNQPGNVIAPCMRMELPYITELTKLAEELKKRCKGLKVDDKIGNDESK
ncbi:hypothetical protein [Falsiporphyromonas endometrii]|uniref:Uncharacterized protein n=1 Tax=Falsiporphyromonas endometrii TaxID=1387297 RepID=A0ABV9K8Z6_9PORP